MAFFDFSHEPLRVDQEQVDGFNNDRLLLQQCSRCGQIQEPARPMCRNCYGLAFTFVEASGRGFLYSWVIPRHGAPEGETHVIGCVELEEGVRLVAEVIDCKPKDVRNGMAVSPLFREGDGSERLAFRPSTPAAEVTHVSKVALKPFHVRPQSASGLWRKTAIVGIGQTEFSKNSGRTELSLAAEASLAAIRDAGLEPSDIDGFVTTTVETNPEPALMECLGINDVAWLGRTPGGGNVACAVVEMAAAAIVTGAARAVLVYRAFNERSGRRFGQPITPIMANQRAAAGRRLNTPSSMYALWFQRYMHEYGVTNEDLGQYSVVARRHAAVNPNAWFYQQPISLADHQASRWIVEPILRLLDCCQESDGGVALVMTASDMVGVSEHPPVYVKSAVQAHGAGIMAGIGYTRSNMAKFEECAAVASQLYRDTNLGPLDIDAAMIYENFTPVVHLQLEAFGFCPPGQAKHFIAEGHIQIGGTLPVNTHGGLLGEAYIHGLNNILEGVRQIRGNSYNQVTDAEHVLVSAGPSGIILGRSL